MTGSDGVTQSRRAVGDGAQLEWFGSWAEFTVIPTLRPIQDFKFRVKWDGQFVDGIIQGQRAQANHVSGRSTARAADPSTGRKSPGVTPVRSDHAGARRHPRSGVRTMEPKQESGSLGAGMGSGSVAAGFSTRTSSSICNRSRPVGNLLQGFEAGSEISWRWPDLDAKPLRSQSSTSSSNRRAGSATPRGRPAERASGS